MNRSARWEGKYASFCLTFVRDQDPATVADLLGGGPLATRTAEQATRAYPAARRGSLLRCGTVPGWAYCYEDQGAVGFLPSRLELLSTGTELVQVVRGGDGMNLACRMVDGRLAERFEPGSADSGNWALPGGRTASHCVGPALLAPRVAHLLSSQPELSGLLAALQAVGEHVGAVVSRPELDGPLPTTFSTFTEPRSTPRPPTRPHGLGPHLGTISLPNSFPGPSGQPSKVDRLFNG